MKSVGLFLVTHCIFWCAFSQEKTEYKPRKNSIYVQNFIVIPTVNYDRMIPLGNKFGFIPKIGLSYFDGIIPFFDASIYVGENKHFGELGLQYWAFEGISINTNYRYMARKGFLGKFGLQYIPGEEALPTIALGYSF